MGNISETLDRAYHLIESEKTSEANLLLTSLLPEHDANPDVWWLLIHSAQTPQQGQLAVNQLRSLSPDYPGLKEIIEKAEISKDEPKVAKPLTVVAQAPTKPPSPIVRVLAFMILFVFAAVLFIFLLSNRLGGATPPVAVQQPTATSAIVAVAPTQESTTNLPFDDDATPTPEGNFGAQTVPQAQNIAFLDNLSVSSNGYTLGGDTLTISLCATPGIEAGNAIRALLEAMGQNITNIPTDAADIDINIDDCFDTGVTLRTLTLKRSLIAEYADNMLTLSQLQAMLTPKA